jgi:hypothetical protein
MVQVIGKGYVEFQPYSYPLGFESWSKLLQKTSYCPTTI